MKKFEEGVFSDLRNLKPGVDACLEEPKVGFLFILFFVPTINTLISESILGFIIQIPMHPYTKEAKGLLLVNIFTNFSSLPTTHYQLGSLSRTIVYS